MPKVVLRGPAQLMSPLGLDQGVGKVGAFVSINGNTWKVPRGEQVDLPAFVVDYMRECRFNVENA
jgi:hypothetical protein